jgi:hypothetical protein
MILRRAMLRVPGLLLLLLLLVNILRVIDSTAGNSTDGASTTSGSNMKACTKVCSSPPSSATNNPFPNAAGPFLSRDASSRTDVDGGAGRKSRLLERWTAEEEKMYFVYYVSRKAVTSRQINHAIILCCFAQCIFFFFAGGALHWRRCGVLCKLVLIDSFTAAAASRHWSNFFSFYPY